MGIRLYNTLTRSRQEFVPSTEGRVSFYVCGLTVQGPAHLGHARSAVAFDAIRRYFDYRGYATRLVYNFTDVDDKIIEKANAEGIPYLQVAQRNIDSFLQQLAALRVKPADIFPRATEHIREMLDMIEILVAKGHAYAVDGDVYFSVPSYSTYGQLSHRPLDEMRPGERIEIDERKHSPLDFTLWKAAKEGEPSWPSPWGPGRPGWHIECSAMSLKYLGNGFDIHGGGEDLIFPHHENEIAQANCYTGTEIFARYWMHNAYVNLGSGKMSKSEGNVVNISQLLDKYGPDVLRLYLLSTHYRHPIMFNWDELDAQVRSVERVKLTVKNVRRVLSGAAQGPEPSNDNREEPWMDLLKEQAEKSVRHFESSMDDDFNTPSALAAIYDLVAEMNRTINAPEFRLSVGAVSSLQAALAAHQRMVDVLQIFVDAGQEAAESITPRLLDLLVSLRTEARSRKEFATGDRIRNALKEMGVILEDHRDGTSWRIAND